LEYRNISGYDIIRRHFGKQMATGTELIISNITAKAALKFGSEAWVLKKERRTTFRSSAVEIFETLTWIYKIR
jgi:hypothetical protein